MTILCATDFSPPSGTAMRLAASLARRRGETLRLLHAVEPAGVDPAFAMVANAVWETEMLATAQAGVDLAAQKMRSTGLTVETSVAPGYPAELILEAGHAPDVSLIVVGSHGRKGVARVILGSCAEKVACSAARPVLVARDTGIDWPRWESSSPLRLALAFDGSSATRAVFFWGRTAAPTSVENVTLVRVYWPPQEGARYGIDEPWLGNEGNPELVKLIEKELRHQSQAFDTGHVPPIRLQVALRNGGEELAHDVWALGVDALVIGIAKHPRRHWTPVSPKAVLRAAQLPVFCIPEGIEPVDRHISRFRSVLIASDLSELSKEAILPAYGLLAGGGQAHLCHVWQDEPAAARPMPAAPSLTTRERAQIEERLRSLVPAEAAERGIGTSVAVLEGTSVAGAIVQTAERLGVDAIAVASHGRSALGRLLLGSVAEEVARRSSLPVLIVHAGTTGPQRAETD